MVSNIFWGITGALDVTISSIVLFLMIEHNNEYYVKVIYKLNSWNLCCCCNALIKDVINHETAACITPNDENPNALDIEDTIHETRGISADFLQAPRPLALDNSELTSMYECSNTMMIK